MAAVKAKGSTKEIDLTSQRETFMNLVKADPGFSEKSMFILLRHIRREDLPDAVFPCSQLSLRLPKKKRKRESEVEDTLVEEVPR